MELALGASLDELGESVGDAGRAGATAAALDGFLRAVEARAFRIAVLGIRDRDEALDVVQDAMIRLVRGYAHVPSAEWPPLFYRILTNRIRDWQRRRAVRRRVLAFFGANDDGEEHDPLQSAPGPAADDPAEHAVRNEALAALEDALARLPERQREAFVLRNLEGLDVAGTAAAMQCSEGSVKTHYFRAVQRLRELLGEDWG
ncbi:MAG TPA: RNA polymerase sigma factor [Gammaproteobacteria bacterium]